ncbi:MAG: Clp protease N-terminal domain-containing protein [Streptosporangiaceae bacterium]|jgi:hypothetical protein
MPHGEVTGAYLEAMRRGFDLARELGCSCGPLHVLVGIAEGSGPVAAALDPGHGPSLRAVVVAAGRAPDNGGYLHMQAQEAAGLFAQARREDAGAAHLLIALLDQGRPDVLGALSEAGLDPAAVRRAALSAIGAAAGTPRLTMPPLAPAGTMDRPALPVAELDTSAWTALRWRQDHLPLGRIRRRSDWDALVHLERNAAWRLVQRPGIDDDQRYSLIWQHADQVGQRLARARPDLAAARRPPGRRGGSVATAMAIRSRRRRHAVARYTAGWGMWLRNRQTGLRDRWFRLRTMRYYRGAPQP